MPYPLITQRLRIQPLSLNDLDSFVEYRQDPDVARFQSWDTSYSSSQALELIQSQQGVELPDEGEWLQLAIHDFSTGSHVGDLALHRIQDEEDAFEIGFTIAKQHQGRRFAKEAASCLISYLSAEAKAKKFTAATDRRNIASVKVLESLGFSQVPEKSWTEEFKNELVTVDFFEKYSE